jgi:hypothetical protein
VVCGLRGLWYDGVGKSGFSVYGRFEACGGPSYGDVKVVQGMVLFCFRCKL